MRFKRAVWIRNPVAGSGVTTSEIRAIRNALLADARDVRLVATAGPGHASVLASEALEAGADLIVVHGGDGTVNEAIQGLAAGPPASLLVLPGGTANVLVRELRLPSSPASAAARLPYMTARSVRVGRVDHGEGRSRYFLLMCGGGLDAEICKSTPTRMKQRLGMLAFWLSGAARALRPFPQLSVSSGAGHEAVGRCGLVVVSKSRRYGGNLLLTPGAHLLSDEFEVVSFSGTNRLALCGYLLSVIGGMTCRWPGVRHSKHERLELVPRGNRPVRFQVDGEVAGTLPATVTLSATAIRLLMPPEYAASRPSGAAD